MLDTREQKRTELGPTETPGGTFPAKSEAKSKPNSGVGARGGNRTPTPCGTRF
jgi:hypothetical protein